MKQNQNYSYEPILLLKNIHYPTYQLYVVAGDNNKDPINVLKICILETIKWLRQRFRAFELPIELDLPDPSDFDKFDLNELSSFHLDMGYKLEVIWLPEDTAWTLQLTEPDLGSKPNNTNEGRPPAPGRLFETNVAYRITTNSVECGFKTVAHEPEGTEVDCEVFRLAFIKQLARNPLVGLHQIFQLTDYVYIIDNNHDINLFKKLLSSEIRTLPIVLYSEYMNDLKAQILPKAFNDPIDKIDIISILPDKTESILSQIKLKENSIIPENLADLARYKMGYAQFFMIQSDQKQYFTKITGISIESGEVKIIEPNISKRKQTSYLYNSFMNDDSQTVKQIDQFIQRYSKGKQFTFGECIFVPEAKIIEQENFLKLYSSKEEIANAFAKQKVKLSNDYRIELNKLKEDIDLREKRELKLRSQIRELKNDKINFKEEMAEIIDETNQVLSKKDTEIDWLKNKQNRPQVPCKVADWVEEYFEDRLIFHEKAKSLMQNIQSNEVDISLICDALDYLANEYREELIGKISKTERDLLCSNKYNRPFDVTPLKGTSINKYPSEYKIKYYIGQKGIPVESLLNLHLRVGNDNENLLRIYFLYDKEKKLIVVGSLPKHLPTISYK